MNKTVFSFIIAAAAALSGNAAASPVADLWKSCEAKLNPRPEGDFYRVRTFGRERQMSDRLLELIAQGEKTVTFVLPWTYEGDRNATPVVGGYSVVTDLDGAPRFIIRTTATKTVPYHAVTEDDAQYEGPGVRTLEAWRRVHWDYFTASLRPTGKTPTEDMPVTVERFEVACKPE